MFWLSAFTTAARQHESSKNQTGEEQRAWLKYNPSVVQLDCDVVKVEVVSGRRCVAGGTKEKRLNSYAQWMEGELIDLVVPFSAIHC